MKILAVHGDHQLRSQGNDDSPTWFSIVTLIGISTARAPNGVWVRNVRKSEKEIRRIWNERFVKGNFRPTANRLARGFCP